MSREITICCPSCTVAPNPTDTHTEQTAYQSRTAYWANLLYFEIYTFTLLWRLIFAFSALTLLDGNQEQHPACKMTQSIHNTHTHPFNGPFSGTTRVSRYQKGKPIWIFLKQETVSGSGISWAICKSAPRSRQITTPTPHHLVFYKTDALPAAQPTASKHWRHNNRYTNDAKSWHSTVLWH